MRQSRLFTAVITIALLGAMVVGCGGPKSVTFPDENLETAIRDALGKLVGEEITPEELAGITTLMAAISDIADLSGLEYCTSLTWLYLSANQISDISPLVENSGLGVGDEVWLEINNLDLSEGSEDIQNIKALEDRGVVFHY